MTRKEALRIMGLPHDCQQAEIKKKYRQLMFLTHPDMGEDHNYPYQASEINVAYEFLLQDRPTSLSNEKKPKNQSKRNNSNKQKNSNEQNKHSNQKKRKESRIRWNAPVNPKARAERPIFHTVEDADGLPIGEAIIDYGRYLWTEEEDFPLFLKSIYYTARKILEEEDRKTGRNTSFDLSIFKEMTYQLAKEYVNPQTILALMTKEKKDIYRTSAMVELKERKNLPQGSLLIPSRLQEHKLYVSNEKGQELGRISFRDDRLYYGIIPLFEDRAAQVKMIVEDGRCKRANGRYYAEISLYLKLGKA